MFIMEDDADWDIRLLAQLTEFAKGVRSLSGIRPSDAQHSPYGDDWEIFWPGHFHKAEAPVCIFGYAVSYRGAQEIIMGLGVKAGANLPIDNGMACLCRDGYLNMKCYSVEPQLFQHHRPAGSVNMDSDINVGHSDAIRERVVTDLIILSARLSIEQLITGSKTYIMQW
ncbi:uncharacterized protein RSE6_02518 [Rhynchosporium secalis]|uniref:Uncharacterized protein n=1 Tax=Rhynchosporium secalis TaxID=38038 RepID=A0A1E1M0F8_RHYSE|nr:uncharacterized protein RSE6_02518 [Rhynchosporium secalis]